MNGTDLFKKTIKEYLDKHAQEDELFAKFYSNPSKDIDKCCNFIINEVKKSGRVGFDDNEIYGLAIHYYNESNIEDKTAPTCKIVVNLSDQTKEHLEKMAAEEYKNAKIAELQKKEQAEKERIRKSAEAKKKKEEANGQLSLFDF